MFKGENTDNLKIISDLGKTKMFKKSRQSKTFEELVEWAVQHSADALKRNKARSSGNDFKIFYIIGGTICLFLLIWWIVSLFSSGNRVKKEKSVTQTESLSERQDAPSDNDDDASNIDELHDIAMNAKSD